MLSHVVHMWPHVVQYICSLVLYVLYVASCYSLYVLVLYINGSSIRGLGIKDTIEFTSLQRTQFLMHKNVLTYRTFPGRFLFKFIPSLLPAILIQQSLTISSLHV